ESPTSSDESPRFTRRNSEVSVDKKNNLMLVSKLPSIHTAEIKKKILIDLRKKSDPEPPSPAVLAAASKSNDDTFLPNILAQASLVAMTRDKKREILKAKRVMLDPLSLRLLSIFK